MPFAFCVTCSFYYNKQINCKSHYTLCEFVLHFSCFIYKYFQQHGSAWFNMILMKIYMKFVLKCAHRLVKVLGLTKYANYSLLSRYRQMMSNKRELSHDWIQWGLRDHHH